MSDESQPRTAETSPYARSLPHDLFILAFPATLQAIVTTEKKGGFSAEVPALPGCYTQGDTIEELTANLREAAEGWMESQMDEAKATASREHAAMQAEEEVAERRPQTSGAAVA